MIFQTGYENSSFLTFISTGILVLFVLFKGKSSVTRIYALYTAAICCWSFCWFSMVHASTQASAWFWACAVHLPASFIPATFLHFVQRFLSIENDRYQTSVRRVFYIIGVIFFLSCFQKWFVLDALPMVGFKFYLKRGPYYFTFIFFFAICVIWTQVLLLRMYARSVGFLRTQVGYIFIAYVIAYAGGGAVFFPIYGCYFPSWILYLIPVGHLIIVYAVFAHRLLDIQIIVRKTVIYSAVSGFLATGYLAFLAISAKTFEHMTGSQTLVSSVLVFCVGNILFNPLRARLQSWMDQRFPRESLDKSLFREASSGFAHEMKRPLANISMPAQLAISDVDQFVQKGWLKSADVVTLKERLSFILNQSHEAADKIEAIRELSLEQDLPKETVNLIEVLNTCLQCEEEHIAKYGIQIEKSFESSVATVVGSAKQLEIALTNVIRNAIEAMHSIPQERKLGCRVQKESNYCVITISDTGHGIRPEDQNRLFNPWFSTKGSKGMGIGLYLTQQIIRRHQGEVKVTSTPGVGTTFTVQLPAR